MEKNIMIDGKPVPFKATASTTRRYRQQFQKDLFADMAKLMTAAGSNEPLPAEALEIFENVAYIMAKQADPTIPADPDDWLDNFEMMSIYDVMPELITLWNMNEETLEEPKKKADQLSDR